MDFISNLSKKLFGIRRNSAHITCYTAQVIDGKERKTEQLTFQKLSYDCCYTEEKKPYRKRGEYFPLMHFHDHFTYESLFPFAQQINFF